MYGVQKGDEPAPLPVEARADVADGFVVIWVGCLEIGNLSDEVWALVLGADAGVSHSSSGRGRFPKHALDVVAEVQALSAWIPDTCKFV